MLFQLLLVEREVKLVLRHTGVFFKLWLAELESPLRHRLTHLHLGLVFRNFALHLFDEEPLLELEEPRVRVLARLGLHVFLTFQLFAFYI